jgi:hypothetical protein
MWVIKCAKYCGRVARNVVYSHPIVAVIPPIIGLGAAAAIMFAPVPHETRVPCGCHEVWVPNKVYVSPETYNKLQAITANAYAPQTPDYGEYYSVPYSYVPPNYIPPININKVPPNLPPANNVPTNLTPIIPPTSPPTNVPEPSSFYILITAIVLTLLVKRKAYGNRI